MRNKQIFALIMVIPFFVCDFGNGGDIVVDADRYEGIVMTVENMAVEPVPIPQDTPLTSYVDYMQPEGTFTEAAESSSYQGAFDTADTIVTTAERWTETSASGIMYVNTEGIYSRIEAIMGSTKVDRYSLNQQVTVSAKTDTDYYRLSDGAYIHSAYLDTSMVSVKTETTTAAPVTEPPSTKPVETEPPVNDPSNISSFVYLADILKNEPEVALKGIDVSWAQEDIDWEAVSKSGIDFVFIRAGRGDIDGTGPKEDTCFLKNIQGANKYGIDVGVYFYSYATTAEEAKNEAKFLLELLQGHTVTYPVVYDMEERENVNYTEIAEAFMGTISDSGYYPMIYSYKSWLDNYLSKEFLTKYAVWVAQNKNISDIDYKHYIWQYSFEGRIDGINTNVDLNIAYRDFAAILKKYGFNGL